jgi:hypothetical protein
VRIDENEQFAVYTINRYGGIVITYSPFTPIQRYGFWNSSSNLFVYSLAVIFTYDIKSIVHICTNI